jgi:L-asparaginase / beta-aspartyl-peptidase
MGAGGPVTNANSRSIPAAVPVRRASAMAAHWLSLLFACAIAGAADEAAHPLALAVHAGAGSIARGDIPLQVEKLYREQLAAAANGGYAVLKRGGTSLEAVETVITALEDSPLFNAGKGAVFADDGSIELDASLMEGATRRCGAVASVKHIKNPISLARLVMERSNHVLMVSTGAEDFAVEQGITLVPQDYFFTEHQWRAFQGARAAAGKPALPRPAAVGDHGTVGCVAMDHAGHLAAGTSTGGLMGKRHGRVGDSPLIGAGTYADDRTCAVSCTGHGEDFIRAGVARDIAARIEYKGVTLAEACSAALAALPEASGGVIAIDREGRIATPSTTSAMFRVTVTPDGVAVVKIFRDE